MKRQKARDARINRFVTGSGIRKNTQTVLSSFLCLSMAALLPSIAAAASSGSSESVTSPDALSNSFHHGFDGVWRIEHQIFAVKTTEDKLPPLNAAGSQIYQKHLASRRAGDTTFDDTTWCGGAGIPRLMFIDRPFQIVLQPNKTVLFYYEWNRWSRLVFLTNSELSVETPSSMGVATAHWDGDTFVVSTNGFRQDTLLDSAGLPHSEQLNINERLRLISPDVLEDKITVTDLAFYTKPWETRVTYHRQPNAEIHEDVCLDHLPSSL